MSVVNVVSAMYQNRSMRVDTKDFIDIKLDSKEESSSSESDGIYDDDDDE